MPVPLQTLQVRAGRCVWRPEPRQASQQRPDDGPNAGPHGEAEGDADGEAKDGVVVTSVILNDERTAEALGLATDVVELATERVH